MEHAFFFIVKSFQFFISTCDVCNRNVCKLLVIDYIGIVQFKVFRGIFVHGHLKTAISLISYKRNVIAFGNGFCSLCQLIKSFFTILLLVFYKGIYVIGVFFVR